MSRLRIRANLRTRVVALGIISAIVLLLLAVSLSAAYLSMRDANRDVTEQLKPGGDRAVALLVALAEADRSVREYAVSGDEAQRSAYQRSIAAVRSDLATLARSFPSHPALSSEVLTTQELVNRWVANYATTAIQARIDGNQPVATAVGFSQLGSQSYDAARTSATDLITTVGTAQDLQFDRINAVSQRFALALAVSGLVLLLGWVGAYVVVRAWVLTPLDQLRLQLQTVAQDGQRNLVITPSGPPELAAVGRDAEHMRRALIVAGDAAAASHAAIEQQSPLVSAIRGELTASPAEDIPGLSIHGELHPAEGVLAGDWWNVVALPGDRAALLLVDVSGHGALAGLTALRLKTAMTVALRNGADPAGVLERAATELTDLDDGSFATAVVVVVDPSAGELSWANGGHPAPWVMRGGSPDRREILQQTGPLLAAIGGSWDTQSTGFGLGDVLLAWSDGFTEARSADAELTDEALADVVRACGNVAPEELVARLVAAVRQDHVEWHRDDVTVVAIASIG